MFYDHIIMKSRKEKPSAAYDIVPMAISGWKTTQVLRKSERAPPLLTYYDKIVQFRVVQMVVKIINTPQRCEICNPSLRCMAGYVEDIYADKAQNDELQGNTKHQYFVHFYFTVPLSPGPSHSTKLGGGVAKPVFVSPSLLPQVDEIFELFIVPAMSIPKKGAKHLGLSVTYAHNITPQADQYLQHIQMIAQQHENNVHNYIEYLKRQQQQQHQSTPAADTNPLPCAGSTQFKSLNLQYTNNEQKPPISSQQQQQPSTKTSEPTKAVQSPTVATLPAIETPHKATAAAAAAQKPKATAKVASQAQSNTTAKVAPAKAIVPSSQSKLPLKPIPSPQDVEPLDMASLTAFINSVFGDDSDLDE